MEEVKKQSGKRIVFFVDDESQVRNAVVETLKQINNCKVVPFANPEVCLKEIQRGGCNLLITDIKMPDMDGLELMEKVKKVRPQLGVLLVTGYGDIPMAVKAVKDGAIDFIEKPLDENTFVPAVKAALEMSCTGELPEAKLLTKTEIVILKKIAEGKSNKVIAGELARSVRTVENHRHRIMNKLGTKNAVALTKKAIIMGFATVELPA